jgi:uncharacterized protein YndB with AHSA1/START domain
MQTQTPTAADTSITLTRTLKASPHDVFAAWTDPETLPRWMSSGDYNVAVAEIDARVGGHYRIETLGPGGQRHVTTGVYQELVPGRRLVKTWIYQGPHKEFENLETLLTVELREAGPDLTELTLKHERLPSTAYRDSVHGGWTALLGKLEALFADGRTAS